MATINFFYQQHAMEHSTVSTDGLTVSMPSEKKEGVAYEVRCEESATGVEVVSCQCLGFKRHHHCKHATVVKSWQDAQAPQVSEITCEVELGQWYIVDHSTQVWMADGEWLAAGPAQDAIEVVKAHIAAEAPEVAEVEQEAAAAIAEAELIVAPRNYVSALVERKENKANLLAECREIKARRSEDLSTKGNLNTGQAFSLLR